MASSESFGHFLLPLTMNKGHIDAKAADYVFTVRAQFLELKKDRPERHAHRNLLGMLAFRLTLFEEAFNFLDKVLSAGEDPDNLNALANRKYICEKLLRFPEARECEQRIDKLLASDRTEEGEKRCRQLRARSLAEQAFAYSFDLFDESMTVERYRTTVDLYEEATGMAGDLINQDEKEDWIIVSGMACHKIYTRSKSVPNEAKMWFQKAVKKFIFIIQESSDANLVSDSWRHLGELFTKSPNPFPSIPGDMEAYVNNPRMCFDKALSYTPRDSRILARYADHYKRNRNYKMALLKVRESIKFDKSVFNQHAYYIKASIFISQYEKQLKDSERYNDIIPDYKLLTYAEQDLRSTALQNSSSPFHIQSLAKVLYYKAKEPNGRVEGSEGQECLQLALTYCSKAAACQDGQKRPDVHRLRGECLSTMGEHQAALRCFKRAVECEIAAQYYDYEGSIQLLVAEYALVLRETKCALSNDSPLLADMVYWLPKVAEICLSTGVTLNTLGNLKELSGNWKTFVKFCEDNGYKTELESIELAATDKRKRSKQPHTYRQQSVPVMGEGASTEVKRHQSFPRERSTEMADPESKYMYNPHVEIEKDTDQVSAAALDPTSAASTSRDDIPTEGDTHMEPVAASLAAVKIDEKTVSSDIIYITYSVDINTGKTQYVSTTPPIQDSSSDDVSSKHVRSAPERPLNRKEREYDFFVIYDNSASEWVQHRMLEELEGRAGFKGCIKDRDFLVGKPKQDNYSDSISNSVCTIVVVTNGFEKDHSCVRNMLLAIELDKLVIPVKREAREMPIHLKPLTSLDATGAVDWDSLVRSIEQQIKLDVGYGA